MSLVIRAASLTLAGFACKQSTIALVAYSGTPQATASLALRIMPNAAAMLPLTVKARFAH